MGGEKGKGRVGGLKAIDPAVAEWQKTAATNPAALTKKQRQDRQRVRVKYDLPPELKDWIEAVAKETGTSASQLAAFLLTWAMGHWGEETGLREAVEESKEPSRSMRFQWNLRLPGE